MDEKLWPYIDATGDWVAGSTGFPRMTGRVLAWLLVCEPAEQTAADLAEALDASKGSISGATGQLVRAGLVDRLHIRGERADRFRMRPGVWDEQIRDPSPAAAREVLALGLKALADEPKARRARLEELDAFYAWWQQRAEDLYEEWQQHKKELNR